MSLRPEDIARIEPNLAHSTGEQAFHSNWRFRRKDGSTFPGAVLSCKSPDGWLQAIVIDTMEANWPPAPAFAQENKDRYFSMLEKRLREAVNGARDGQGRMRGDRPGAWRRLRCARRGRPRWRARHCRQRLECNWRCHAASWAAWAFDSRTRGRSYDDRSRLGRRCPDDPRLVEEMRKSRQPARRPEKVFDRGAADA